MVKVKKLGTKSSIVSSNWNEDDVSKTGKKALKKKKMKIKKTHSVNVDKKISKNEAKNVEKAGDKYSKHDDFEASLDKLKEIDPEFYKV